MRGGVDAVKPGLGAPEPLTLNPMCGALGCPRGRGESHTRCHTVGLHTYPPMRSEKWCTATAEMSDRLHL
jgi:hypothetical protein